MGTVAVISQRQNLQIFKEIGGEEWSNLGALRHCMGDINEDKASDILDKEMVGQRGDEKVRLSSVFSFP
jgi:hypothetical protein